MMDSPLGTGNPIAGDRMDRFWDHVGRMDWNGSLDMGAAAGYSRQPWCGDELWVEAAVTEGVIRRVRFRGRGCAVSTACASMLCEGVEGQPVHEVLAKTAVELMAFEVESFSESKRRCALLGWDALKIALLTWTSVVKPMADTEVSDGAVDVGCPLGVPP